MAKLKVKGTVIEQASGTTYTAIAQVTSFNISGIETETYDSRTLDGTAGGRAVCVVGIPSDYWGEVIVAVAESPPPGWEDEAAARVAALARHKHPRAFLALPELPRNAQGKVVRARVREAVLARWRLEDGPHPRLVKL